MNQDLNIVCAMSSSVFDRALFDAILESIFPRIRIMSASFSLLTNGERSNIVLRIFIL
jgi:hypothetical protein